MFNYLILFYLLCVFESVLLLYLYAKRVLIFVISSLVMALKCTSLFRHCTLTADCFYHLVFSIIFFLWSLLLAVSRCLLLLVVITAGDFSVTLMLARS